MAGSSPRGPIGAVVLVDDKKYETGLGHEYEEDCNDERYISRPWFRWAIVDRRCLCEGRRYSSWEMSEFYVQEWCSRHPKGLNAMNKHGMVRDTVDNFLQIVKRVYITVVM